MPRYYIRSGRGRYEVRDRQGERHILTYSDRDMRPTPDEIASARNIYDARHKAAGDKARAHAESLNANV